MRLLTKAVKLLHLRKTLNMKATLKNSLAKSSIN